MDDTTVAAQPDPVQLAADIVSAYVSNNPVRATDLPGLIVSVRDALVALSTPAAAPADAVEKASPAQIRKSITPDALISFVDGKPYKTLKRHLNTHGVTFEEYRARYGLPADYPAVAVSYSEKRSALAKSLGLGQIRRKAVEAAPATAPAARKSSRKKAVEPVAAE